jgi:hypothetical protein
MRLAGRGGITKIQYITLEGKNPDGRSMHGGGGVKNFEINVKETLA